MCIRFGVLDKYTDFKKYVEKKLESKPIRITKEAGVFVCTK